MVTLYSRVYSKEFASFSRSELILKCSDGAHCVLFLQRKYYFLGIDRLQRARRTYYELQRARSDLKVWSCMPVVEAVFEGLLRRFSKIVHMRDVETISLLQPSALTSSYDGSPQKVIRQGKVSGTCSSTQMRTRHRKP